MMKKEETPWSQYAVFVCTKCHKSIDEKQLQEEGNCGENLKNFLKSQMRGLGKAGEIRVMTSSCLDICEKGYQAVTITPVAPSARFTETFILHPEKDRQEILNYLLKDHPIG